MELRKGQWRDAPFRKRVIRPAMEARRLLFGGVKQLGDEIALGPEVHAAPLRCVARVEEREAVVVFLAYRRHRAK